MDEVRNKIKKSVPENESTKVLMITHKVLATQQGYEKLLDILNDSLRDKEDQFLLFFMNTIEPVFKALCESNSQLLFDTLGIKRYPINKKSEKEKWKKFQLSLTEARTKAVIDVLNVISEFKLVPMPPQIIGYYSLYENNPETVYIGKTTIKEYLDLDYTQFLAAIEFLYPEAEFSTEHGVKGEEYDNVIFVIGRGWNQYQFETYAPMMNGILAVPKEKESAYERNRNLFYVCCSRPKKRLIMFVTIPINDAFHSFLTSLVGNDNILTYTQFITEN